MKDSKGFTLIELLAVIIILGVIMLIAIPSVTTQITNSRKLTYAQTAKGIISGARTVVNSGDLPVYKPGTTYYIIGISQNIDLQTKHGQLGCRLLK